MQVVISLCEGVLTIAGLLIRSLDNHKDSFAEPSAYSNEFDQ